MIKKLFISNADNESLYEQEVKDAAELISSQYLLLSAEELTYQYIIEHKITVIISAGLKYEQYLMCKGLGVVTITFNKVDKYSPFSDIVIDYLKTDDIRYFTGEKFKVSYIGTEINEILELVSVLKWDSGFFGFPVAYLSCMHLTENIFKAITPFLESEKIKLLEYLCNCHDRSSVEVAEKNGFNFTDIRVVLTRSLNSLESAKESNYQFGLAKVKHIDCLRQIARGIYKNSRYYFDGHFSESKIDEFYQDWVEKAVRGTFDDVCICLFDKEQPISFCTLNFVTETKAKIGLFGVEESYHGKGVGAELMERVLLFSKEKGINKMEVVTQGRNYPAQKLYQKSGFTTKYMQQWYHKWY